MLSIIFSVTTSVILYLLLRFLFPTSILIRENQNLLNNNAKCAILNMKMAQFAFGQKHMDSPYPSPLNVQLK